jgi:hypothetical protein
MRNREGWKNEKKNNENGKLECSPFILDNLMISLQGTEDEDEMCGIACTN